MLPGRSSLMGSRQPTRDLFRGVFARLGSLYIKRNRMKSGTTSVCPSQLTKVCPPQLTNRRKNEQRKFRFECRHLKK
jgi:hypothetical protein